MKQEYVPNCFQAVIEANPTTHAGSRSLQNNICSLYRFFVELSGIITSISVLGSFGRTVALSRYNVDLIMSNTGMADALPVVCL